jgi:hypothetical protein
VPRVGVAPSAVAPRVGVALSAVVPRVGVALSAVAPRVGVALSAVVPRVGVALSAADVSNSTSMGLLCRKTSALRANRKRQPGRGRFQGEANARLPAAPVGTCGDDTTRSVIGATVPSSHHARSRSDNAALDARCHCARSSSARLQTSLLGPSKSSCTLGLVVRLVARAQEPPKSSRTLGLVVRLVARAQEPSKSSRTLGLVARLVARAQDRRTDRLLRAPRNGSLGRSRRRTDPSCARCAIGAFIRLGCRRPHG